MTILTENHFINLYFVISGIQKGRYTIEKKSRTIKEVKRLKQAQKEDELKDLADAMFQVYQANPFINPDRLKQLPDLQNQYMVRC